MVENNSPTQPKWVCLSCGTKYGQHVAGGGATWNKGVCGVCGKIRSVTEPRDFGYLAPWWMIAGK